MFLHGLLLFVIISPWFRKYYTFSPTGGNLPGLGGGGGNGGEQYIALAALRPAPKPAPEVVEQPVVKPVVPPPTEVPTVIPPPTPEPDTIPASKPNQTQGETGAAGATAGGAGTGGGSGGGNGGGQGPGTGTGMGPGTGGSLRGTPPEQRQLLYPPMQGTPKALRGKPVTVMFYVSSTGQVERISTVPELPGGSYKRDFEAAMMGFRFRPARDSLGVPVAGVATAVVNLSNQ